MVTRILGEGIMADMGTFRTTIAIENALRRGERRTLPNTLVDAGPIVAAAT